MAELKASQRLVQLSWQILEAKYRYYILCKPNLEDWEFDEIEREYRDLCDILGVEPTASDMVGFDSSRPSCQLVRGKVFSV